MGLLMPRPWLAVCPSLITNAVQPLPWLLGHASSPSIMKQTSTTCMLVTMGSTCMYWTHAFQSRTGNSLTSASSPNTIHTSLMDTPPIYWYPSVQWQVPHPAHPNPSNLHLCRLLTLCTQYLHLSVSQIKPPLSTCSRHAAPCRHRLSTPQQRPAHTSWRSPAWPGGGCPEGARASHGRAGCGGRMRGGCAARHA